MALRIPKISEEHMYPRKVAAKELLGHNTLDAEKMLQAFINSYALVHYITPDENKMVTRFQKTSVFKSPEEAYQLAGIHFVTIDRTDFRKIKRRDRAVIESYLGKTNEVASSTPPPPVCLRDGLDRCFIHLLRSITQGTFACLIP